ncbi:MAG: DNA repair protein RecO [Cellulosilyticaceae bacterium]
MITKVNGIIIKEYVVGESDKYITLFTKEMGKIQVGAPKAKKFDRGLASGTQLFVFGEFLISGYKDTYKLLSVEVTHMFHQLSEDLMALSYATYVAEFISEVATENGENGGLLTLMLHALHNISKPQAPLRLIRCIFEIRAMALLGFMLELNQCTQCDEKLNFQDEGRYALNIEEGGILCDTCVGDRSYLYVSYSTCYTLYYIIYSPIKQCFRFNVEPSLLEELCKLCEAYVPFYIEKQFKSLAFIKSVEMLG